MEKRGKQRLGVCAALVLLLLGGFMDNNVKTELKRSVGAQFCYLLAVEKKVEWPMEVLAVYPVKKRNVTAKIEYDPEQLQKENEELLQEENDSQETLALQQDTAVQSENVAAVPASGVTSNTGEEAFVKKLWETKDVHYLWDHFYIVDSTTSVKRKLFPVERLLKRDMKLPVQNGKKQILIYHTHGASESFSDSRSGKVADGVIGVGEKLAKELEKNGYEVIHDTTKYDWMDGKIDRSKAYNVSLAGVQKQLEKNPDIQVIIDLHRDSVGKNRHTYTTIDGKRTAIAMFFNGMSRNQSGEIAYLTNPNREANLAFSLQLKCHAMELFDGFTKPIYLKGYRYNLHLKERALLIELGNENNTVEEAMNAAAPLAKVIADVLKGDVKHSFQG